MTLKLEAVPLDRVATVAILWGAYYGMKRTPR